MCPAGVVLAGKPLPFTGGNLREVSDDPIAYVLSALRETKLSFGVLPLRYERYFQSVQSKLLMSLFKNFMGRVDVVNLFQLCSSASIL